MITGLKFAAISAVLSAGVVSGLDFAGESANGGKLYTDRVPTSLILPSSASDSATVEIRDEAGQVSTLVRMPALRR